MADAGAFTANLRRDFFVGVIFSAAGLVAGSGNNFAGDDLAEEAAVGTPTPEGFFGRCTNCPVLITGVTADGEQIFRLWVFITYCGAGGWLGGARCVDGSWVVPVVFFFCAQCVEKKEKHASYVSKTTDAAVRCLDATSTYLGFSYGRP